MGNLSQAYEDIERSLLAVLERRIGTLGWLIAWNIILAVINLPCLATFWLMIHFLGD